jgi:hemoglobin
LHAKEGDAVAQSLYERIGGEAAVMAAVRLFYDKVVADPLVSHFFTALDMEAQIKKQMAFLTWALGGPEEYRGRPLGQAHAKLVQQGLGNEHFDRVVVHLEATLRELGVAPELVAESLAIVAPTRAQVLAGR